MAEPGTWIVTLSGDRPAGEVRRDLSDSGFRVDQVLEEIGVIIGRCGAEVAETLRGLKGVADVSPDSPVELGPPGSPDTF